MDCANANGDALANNNASASALGRNVGERAVMNHHFWRSGKWEHIGHRHTVMFTLRCMALVAM
ncbi:hypothetical protein XAR_3371 [Xanthomonas citri pv. glycines str. 8ra]|nr:hypothetical protein XAR_3371 [Xanthomonas citri pv. glycines str. 8ra]